MADGVTVMIDVPDWKRLSALKEPGDSMAKVVKRLLDEREEREKAGREAVQAS